MSRTSELAAALLEADGNWIASSALSAMTDIDASRVSALIAYLKTKGLIDGRLTASREAEYRVADKKRLAEYIDRVDSGKRLRTPEAVAAIDHEETTDAKDEGARIVRAACRIDEVPKIPSLCDALAKQPTANGLRQAVSRSSTSTPPTEPPVLRVSAKRDGEPKPAEELSPRTRIGCTWAIDHRGKLILCFGDAAFELQPKQWTPLARFLRSLEPEFAT